MLSKSDRFQKWRGAKASQEAAYIKTAELYSAFMDNITSLGGVKADLIKAQKPLGQYHARSLSAVLCAKLVLDEYIEQLPSAPENAPLRAILNQITPILTSFYDNPKALNEAQVNKLVTNIGLIIQLDDSVFADKKQKEKLLFPLYTLLQVLDIKLSSLNAVSTLLMSAVVDIKNLQIQVKGLLEGIEEKNKVFNPKVQQRKDEALKADALATLQAYFNGRYLKIINSSFGTVLGDNSPKLVNTDKLGQLEAEMAQVSKGVARLAELRKVKSELESKINILSALLHAAEENDTLVSGRDYFLDFMELHQKAYQLFLDNLEDSRKAPFLEKVAQLSQAEKEQALSIQVTHALSQKLAPAIQVYRAWMAQSIQNMVTNVMPATLDSECKISFRENLTFCIAELKREVVRQQGQMNDINLSLFGKDNPLSQQLIEEPDTTFVALQKSTDAALEAVKAYRNILSSARANMDFLYTLQAHSESLSSFVQLHNNFWVKLSNFFAQFLSIFKSDTAQMIDRANEYKTKVDELGLKYQEAVDKELQQIDSDPNVEQDIKEQLQEQFHQELEAAKPVRVDGSDRKGNVRRLMWDLDGLFAKNPEPEIEEYTPAVVLKI